MSSRAAASAVFVLLAVLLGRVGPVAGARLRRVAVAPGAPGQGGGGDGSPADPALVLDLVAAAMAAGAPESGALAVVADAVGGPDGQCLRLVAHRMRLGAGGDAAWAGLPASLAALRRCVQLSAATGAPGAALLRESAQELRRARHRHAQVAAQRLGVRVVLPLGLCALPGFAAWGVVPVVLGLAADVLHG
jgi:pilus assembly protein TadC